MEFVDPWERQHALARTTVAWSALSVVGGALALRRRDPWWRSFGRQHLGWAGVDLAIVAAVTALQHRRMRRLTDPYAPVAVEHERHQLRVVLTANAVADAGYVAVGALLWRRGRTPRAAGAGAAIVVQGGFLLAHDSWHALRGGP